MKRLLPASAAVLAAALTLGAGASAQVTSLPLPAPPVAGNAASSTIFDAMLAIARAARSNPAAAQQATFQYNAAIQQYNAGDLARARMSALQAIMVSGGPPAAQATSIPAPPIPQPVYVTMPNVLGANEADAEAYVALARRALTVCGAPGVAAPAAAQRAYAASVNAVVAQKFGAARDAAQQTIDQCAAAAAAYGLQQQQQPGASPMPVEMGTYSPLPLATLGPDPALQQTPTPVVMPSTTPAAAQRRGFHLF
jgi:hypothetical protein